jgi:Cft2 family RNA processing exonuclease
MDTRISDVQVKLTPLLGGCEDGAVCSLLEIGHSKILLDCGCLVGTSPASLENMKAQLKSSGPIDAILLSHADLVHMGALPMLFGLNGILSLSPTIHFMSYIIALCHHCIQVFKQCLSYVHSPF